MRTQRRLLAISNEGHAPPYVDDYMRGYKLARDQSAKCRRGGGGGGGGGARRMRY